jgi:hypothetical protein
MTSNIVHQTPYLRTSRNFPQEAQPLAVEINRSYLDIAEKMNDRMIGIHPTNRSAINGESWFITSRKQQALRQLYTFTGTGNIPHGITNWNSVSFISPKSYGTFTDGSNWYGVPFLGSIAVTAEVSFYVTSTNIVVVAGAGAPSITQGYINLEWVSQI